MKWHIASLTFQSLKHKLGYSKISCFVSVSQSTIFLSLWYFTQPRPIFVKYFTQKSLRCSRPLRFPAENKADADSRNFHSSKIARSNFINNTVKPKFHLPFELLGSQSCKSDTKRNQTDYNGQIYLSIATKTNQLIRVAKSEMDPHFKTTSLLKSREKRSTDVLPFSSGFR